MLGGAGPGRGSRPRLGRVLADLIGRVVVDLVRRRNIFLAGVEWNHPALRRGTGHAPGDRYRWGPSASLAIVAIF